ncbi:MAG: adenosylcobinamide-phosphate synthase, partial [Actinomycetota bacterium]|nr:adenosylcobinamide-phosphate synthase [Actinomycetota bacterium]
MTRGAPGQPPRPAAAHRRARGRSLAAGAGLVADRLLGEPPEVLHPVAAFGRAMIALERRLRSESGSGPGPGEDRRARIAEWGFDSWRDGRGAGTGYALAGVGLGWAAGFGLG